MKSVHFISVGAIVLGAGIFLFSQEKEDKLDRVSRQVEALRKEVSFLATQVELLKKDLINLRMKGAGVPPGVPEGAYQDEINGVKYYLVPVDQDPDTESP